MARFYHPDRLAARPRRLSGNLLVLAEHQIPGQWHRPMALTEAIRAAVYEIEEHERASS
jgi:hypothetical protein